MTGRTGPADTAPPLLQRLGGRAAIDALVTELFQRLQSEPELAPWFGDRDVGWIRASMASFLLRAAGGDEVYRGQDLAFAHRDLRVTDRAFAILARLLAASAMSCGLPQAERSELTAIVLALREQIVTA